MKITLLICACVLVLNTGCKSERNGGDDLSNVKVSSDTPVMVTGEMGLQCRVKAVDGSMRYVSIFGAEKDIVYVELHPDGTLKSVSSRVRGKEVDFRQYSIDGVLEVTRVPVAGTYFHVEKTYNPDGTIKEERRVAFGNG